MYCGGGYEASSKTMAYLLVPRPLFSHLVFLLPSDCMQAPRYSLLHVLSLFIFIPFFFTMEDTTVVSISGLPFDQTEEQVMEIARSVGPVEELRLIFDTMTGKSKGSAYVKYSEHETAASAVRNLNNLMVGTRNIKCSFSSDQFISGSMGDSDPMNQIPPLPLGMQIYGNQNPAQVIANALSSLDQTAAYQIIKDARQMSIDNPPLMKRLLEQAPQLSHALVEICLLLNLTNRDLVELCLNRKQMALDELTDEHAELLRQIYRLTDEETRSLTADKRRIITSIKEEIDNGSYGQILETTNA